MQDNGQSVGEEKNTEVTNKKRVAKKSSSSSGAPKKKRRKKSSGPPVGTMFRNMYFESVQSDDCAAHIIQPEAAYRVGIAIPLPLQYVIGCEVLPLGVLVDLNGPPQSCKTMLSFELGSYFVRANGWIYFYLTEGKISHELAQAMIGPQYKLTDVFHPYSTPTMNMWQKLMQDKVAEMNELFRKGNKAAGIPKGGFTPIIHILDSLMGANIEEENARIAKAGFANRTFPAAAASISNFEKMLVPSISNTPQLIVSINHRKEHKDELSGGGRWAPVIGKKAGGHHPQFQASYELITHMRRKDENLIPQEGGKYTVDLHRREIEIVGNKNSAGTDGNKINVWVKWYKKRVGNRMVLRTKFEWNAAITRMLIDWHNKGKTSDTQMRERYEALDQYFHIRPERGGKFWSKTLGIPKNEAVTASEMGYLITRDRDAYRSIQDAMGISRGFIMRPGDDYFKLRNLAEKATDKVNEELMQQAEELQTSPYAEDQLSDVVDYGDDRDKFLD